MDDTEEKDDIPLTISDMAAFAAQLRRLADAHDELSAWIGRLGKQDLLGTNIKTARRATGQIWAFLASIVRAYGDQIDETGLGSARLSEQVKATVVEAVLRHPEKPKRKVRERGAAAGGSATAPEQARDVGGRAGVLNREKIKPAADQNEEKPAGKK